MEFCDLHPSAQVIGTDLSPIQPREVPVNCEFLIDDCEEEWLFRKHFELIHTRAMLLSIKNWPRFFEQAYAHLVPGGYLELQDITYPAMCMDTSLTPETSPMLQWSSLFVEAATRLGLDVTAPRYFGQMLHDAGFVDVRLKIYTWPVGKWAKGEKWKTLGEYAQSNLMDWLGGGSLWLFIKMLGWSRIKLELFLAEVRRELRDRTERQFYAHVYFWYARKPAIGEAWNPTATPFVLEESIELEVDEEATAGSAASSTTPSSALTLKSPVTSLVIPATELSLASPRTASRSTTPKQSEAPRRSMYISDEEDDSSENSTIQTPSDEGTSTIAFPKTSVNGTDTRKDSGPVAADVATASDAGKTGKGKEANSRLPNVEREMCYDGIGKMV